MNVTDDGKTDGTAIAYSEREREFTFAKNSRNQCGLCTEAASRT